MSHTPEELLKLASHFDNVATRALVVTAKKKEKKKLDPKAKVRNRGTVCVPAESAKDKKDHFPINDEGQARNALARVQQLSSAPWYKGSLEGLKALVARKVKAKYPGIDVGGKDSKKKASEYYDTLLSKYAQGAVKDQDYAKNLTDSRIQSINAINAQTLTPEQVKEQAGGYLQSAFNDFNANLISQEQYSQIVQAGQQKMFGTDNRQGPVPINWNAKPQQTQSTPAQTATPAKPRSKFGPIDPTFQIMLGVNNDGSLGPQTQSALEMYKKSIGLPYGKDPATRQHDSNKNNQQAFESLKQRPEYKTKSKMVYDDTSDVYQAPAGGIVRQNPF